MAGAVLKCAASGKVIVVREQDGKTLVCAAADARSIHHKTVAEWWEYLQSKSLPFETDTVLAKFLQYHVRLGKRVIIREGC